MNQLKKKGILTSIPIILILFGIGVFMLSRLSGYLQKPTDLKSVDYDGELDGVYVTGVVEYIYDWYCNTVEEGSDKEVSCEYIIDAGDDYYMGMLVPASKTSQANALMEACWNYDGTNFSDVENAQYKVRGTIREMPKDSMKYYYQYLDECGLTAEEQMIFLPYYLEVGAVGSRKSTADSIVYLVISSVLIFFAVFILVRALRGSGLKQIRQYIANSANPESARERVDAFLDETAKDGSLRFNREFICGNPTGSIVFQEAKNLVWAYQKTITHKRNFITVGHSYYIVLGFLDGKRHEITMKNETEAQERLTALEGAFPGVILGYNDELDKLFRKNMPEFLNLKYNQAQTNTF